MRFASAEPRGRKLKEPRRRTWAELDAAGRLLLAAVKEAKVPFEAIRQAYSSGQSTIDTREDPEGTKGHTYGIESAFTFLADKHVLGDATEAEVEWLIGEIGA